MADNIHIERFWRTLKYECIFLLGIETVDHLKHEVAIYIEYYNKRRLHSNKTPDSVYTIDNHEPLVYCIWPLKEDRIRKTKRVLSTCEASAFITTSLPRRISPSHPSLGISCLARLVGNIIEWRANM